MKTLWTNGSILNITNQTDYDWITTNDDLILDLGFKNNQPNSDIFDNVIDLEGATLMPAFIDPHSHFSANVYSFIQADLSECLSFEDIGNTIKNHIVENKLTDDEWITATGYDHNFLEEKDHPRKEVLDAISLTNPIAIHHQSGHFGVFNSAALAYLGIDENTPVPSGGSIETDENGLTGYMEENAFIDSVKRAPMPDMDAIQSSIEKAAHRYLSYGITTVQEGMMVKELIPLYEAIINGPDLHIDIIYYTGLADKDKVLDRFPLTVDDYHSNVKFGGVKLFLDGSPQGKTAWLREPYLGDEDNCGYGTMSDQQLYDGLTKAYEEEVQPLAHCNGDAAVAQYVNVIRKLKAEGKDLGPLRPVVIHAQLLGRDQMKDIDELGMIPSFFLAHIFHWGDIHIANFGMDRADYISPAKTALSYGIPFTLHQDSPVIPPNMIETIACAVNRTTKQGVVLGESEKLTAQEAITAVTSNAAHQYFEEGIKGTLETGKRANFVILSDNPMTVRNDQINSIQVLKTVKDGRVVYSK
ncbi:MAG: amidohydrolase family protein [Clostridiaceae bacterium]|nr:amidohydrolase family protein [Clostridiaceae bacterium]